MTRKAWSAVGIVAPLVVAAWLLSRSHSVVGPDDPSMPEAATYVGGAACAGCHATEYEAWSGSHHDLAMEEATPENVLGDFSGVDFTHRGVTATFSQHEGGFFVRTEGADGTLGDFEVGYTFGVEPLQQYLLQLPGGHLQALTIAWDTRPTIEGGQRWFHLYPDEDIGPGDPLHWTSRDLSWAYQCAECHSTDLRKNYDLATDTYETTWSDIDVSCEACHGPGSRHLAIVEQLEGGSTPDRLGLSGAMSVPPGGWLIEAGTSIARRTEPLPDHAEVETCAHCHSRRSALEEGRLAGTPLHDSDLVARLEPGLYFPDGQILDEVYVYGSFVQSKMYSAGVRCSDCHDPHTLRPKAEGNALCSGCHLPTAFDTPEHHHHPVGSTGAACVECHMPARAYMVVDPRRDHSLRVPRPDLSQQLGVPNACTTCHADRDHEWATAAVLEWYGEREDASEHFAFALDAGRRGLPGAGEGLRQLALNGAEPGIARATALAMTSRFVSEANLGVVDLAATDPDPMVRVAALTALEPFPPDVRLRGGFRLLRDSVQAVRIEAARILAPVRMESLSADQRGLLERVSAEYVAAVEVNRDHPAANVSLGNFRMQRGDAGAAEASYRAALSLDPGFVPAYLNLADLYRATGRDPEGRTVLEAALDVVPQDANVHHAMGLLLVRLGDVEDAIPWLEQAVELGPEQPRFAYVLAVGLNSVGASEGALAALGSALSMHPYDRELLTLAATLHRDSGDVSAAIEYAEQLVVLDPSDQSAARLLAGLRGPPR